MMQTRQRLIHAARYSAQAFLQSGPGPASSDFGSGRAFVRNEADHFYICEVCQQAVDMRDLGQLLHHEAAGHMPFRVS